MTVSADDFKKALGQFASGVTVVTAPDTKGQPVGVTVSAFSSLSLSPPMILVCLDNETTALGTYTGGSHFGVNILSITQEEVSNAFAFPSDVPPFTRFAHDIDANGVPLLHGALANLSCRRERVIDGGDHKIIIGLVETARSTSGGEPLLYAQGKYAGLAPVDTSDKKTATETAKETA